MNVVGIDLSLTSTGLIACKGGSIVDMENVKSKGTRKDALADRRERLFAIANEVVAFVEDVNTDVVVIEAPSYGSKFGSQHDRSGLWWLVVNALLGDKYPYPIAMVAPQSRAKYGTGKGNAKKDVVLAHVIERYQDLAPGKIANDDLADALLLAAMGSRWYGYQVEATEPPEANLEALNAVIWPSV